MVRKIFFFKDDTNRGYYFFQAIFTHMLFWGVVWNEEMTTASNVRSSNKADNLQSVNPQAPFFPCNFNRVVAIE